MHPVSIWPKEYTRSVDICKQHPLGKLPSTHIRDLGPGSAPTPLLSFYGNGAKGQAYQRKLKRSNSI